MKKSPAPVTRRSSTLVPAREAAWRTRLAPTGRSLIRVVDTAVVCGSAANPYVRLDDLLGERADVPFGRFTVASPI